MWSASKWGIFSSLRPSRRLHVSDRLYSTCYPPIASTYWNYTDLKGNLTYNLWAKEKNLLKSAILLAIPQDNPDKTLPENCRFDACIVNSKDYQIDDSIYESEFFWWKILIYKVKHTAEDIQKA